MAEETGPDSWSTAQQIVDAWPAVSAALPASGTSRRLRHALVALSVGDAGWLDVAALIRQVLLEHEARHGTTARMTVPAGAPFPTGEEWADVGCRAFPVGPGRLSVGAELWHPPVGADESAETVAEDIRRVYMDQEKVPQSCPGDPFWAEALGARFTTYKSLGQRQAARTVMLAPPGSTSIVCLPTGQGKTEVALAPALFASRHSGVSVLVVPTVVLAFDHERRIQNLLTESEGRPSPSGRYAYTGGTPDHVKEAIREAVRAGTQRVVVASPEAVEQGLSGCLTATASEGRLQYLILDEAHLVDQWGSAFRPEFQTLASQRLTWLDLAPPGREVITVAMSATLTTRHVTTLTRLFGPEIRGDFALTWASATRCEPSYYLTTAENQDVRDATIETAVVRLPRPLVLYASTKKDVEKWAVRLRAAGLRRVGVVKGDSDDEERREALEGWRGQRATGEQIATRYDIVVGTSAFGLGVDMPNVRTVLHACLPETIDRYYQEVGRSGRDRKPSIAYLVKTPSDDRIARNLNQVTTIGKELGWSRWSHMLNSARRTEIGTYEIDLASIPAHLPAGYGQSRQWNVRTLNLMVWAGLIQTQAPEPPSPRPDENEEEFAARREDFYENARTRIAVRLLTGAATTVDLWTEAIEAERAKVADEQHDSLQSMYEVLRGKRCTSELIADHYRTHWGGGTLRTAVNCRGCPACRARLAGAVTGDDVPGMCRAARDPHPRVRFWPGHPEDPLAKIRGGSPWLSLTWQTPDDLGYLRDLLVRLAGRGMAILGGPGLDVRLAGRVQERAQFAPVIIDHDESMLRSFPGWIVWVLDPGTRQLEGAIRDRLIAGEATYLVHHRDLPDLDRSRIPLVQIYGTISLRAALGEL